MCNRGSTRKVVRDGLCVCAFSFLYLFRFTLGNSPETISNPLFRYNTAVLEEIHRQKLDEKEIDWEKVRNESLRSSAKGVENGYVTGKEDEVARIRAWDPSIKPPANLNSSSKNDGRKKKKGGFFSFLNGGKK